MDNHLQINQNAEQTYHSIRQSIVSAQHKLSAAVNYAMVITYWEIGRITASLAPSINADSRISFGIPVK